jgi:acyl-CoA synthetase (AMP-forming)/AMP-acid ligase II
MLEGYWEQPDATAEAIVDGWFHTGDGGYLDDEGYLTISDRKKDVIISGGENVSSIEVEDCLVLHPAVAEVAVIGVPDEKWGETVKALVVLAPGRERRRAGPDRLLPRTPGALQVPHVDRVPRRAGPHRHRQAPEVQAARAPTGRVATSR